MFHNSPISLDSPLSYDSDDDKNNKQRKNSGKKGHINSSYYSEITSSDSESTSSSCIDPYYSGYDSPSTKNNKKKKMKKSPIFDENPTNIHNKELSPLLDLNSPSPSTDNFFSDYSLPNNNHEYETFEEKKISHDYFLTFPISTIQSHSIHTFNLLNYDWKISFEKRIHNETSYIFFLLQLLTEPLLPTPYQNLIVTINITSLQNCSYSRSYWIFNNILGKNIPFDTKSRKIFNIPMSRLDNYNNIDIQISMIPDPFPSADSPSSSFKTDSYQTQNNRFFFLSNNYDEYYSIYILF